MSEVDLGSRTGAMRRSAGPPPLPDAGRRQQIVLAWLLLAIGSIWIGVPLLALIKGGPPPLPELGSVGVGVLLAAGAGQALWGVDLLLRRKTLTIDQNSVHVAVGGLLGMRGWSEPLAGYRGLRHRRERVRHRYGWRIEHRLQLAHPDPAKEIDLFRARGERGIEAARRQWAQWLGLPVWSAEGGAAPRRPLPAPERRPAEPKGAPT